MVSQLIGTTAATRRVSFGAGGAKMLGLLLAVVLLLPLGGAVPSRAPPRLCRRCCDHLGQSEDPTVRSATPYQMPEIRTYVNMTILKGDKGDRGDRGTPGKAGQDGPPGARGPIGSTGSKGQAGVPGEACKTQYSAFSVGRRKALHSTDYYQALVFDTVFVNLDEHFNMFEGKFYCSVPGIYFFNLNVHTWNFKETYLHLMHNEQNKAIVYAQPSDRSIMQSQGIMLLLGRDDKVWVRLYKRERENAVYSDDVDVYITFSGFLVKPTAE